MSRSRRLSTTGTARTSAGRLLVLLAAFAGLLAMHGLSDHGAASFGADSFGAASFGAAGHGAMVPGLDARQAGDMTLSGGPHHSGTRSAMALAPGATADSHGSGGHDSMAGAVGACLALLAATVLLILGSVRSWSRVVRRSALASGQLIRLVASARDPAPPDLLALSIQRC